MLQKKVQVAQAKAKKATTKVHLAYQASLTAAEKKKAKLLKSVKAKPTTIVRSQAPTAVQSAVQAKQI